MTQLSNSLGEPPKLEDLDKPVPTARSISRRSARRADAGGSTDPGDFDASRRPGAAAGPLAITREFQDAACRTAALRRNAA